MFETARLEIASRIVDVKKVLAAVGALREKPDVSSTCRGLIFVALYGVYEFAVTASVQGALRYIQSHSLSCNDIRRSLLSLVLHPSWMSANAAGRKRIWQARCELVEEMASEEPLVELDDSLFPNDGSHFGSGQLQTIWSVFGVSAPIVPEPRLLGRIEELLENRNAIAHGRRTASEVGRSYSLLEMDDRAVDIDRIANYVVATMDAHCSRGGLEG